MSAFITPYGANLPLAFLFIVGMTFWGAISLPLWLKVFMRFFKSKDLEMTIKQEFPGSLDSGSFTEDDISLFLRTCFKLSLTCIKDVFFEEKLPFEEIEKFVQNINNNYVSVTAGNDVNVSGGAIGVGNRVSSRN